MIFWPAAYVLITVGFAIMQMAEEPSEAGAELEFRGIPVIKSHDDLGVPLQANTPFQDKEHHTCNMLGSSHSFTFPMFGTSPNPLCFPPTHHTYSAKYPVLLSFWQKINYARERIMPVRLS